MWKHEMNGLSNKIRKICHVAYDWIYNRNTIIVAHKSHYDSVLKICTNFILIVTEMVYIIRSRFVIIIAFGKKLSIMFID